MTPITIKIQNTNIAEIYCYVGYLFIVTHEGEIFSVSLKLIYSNLSAKYHQLNNFLKLALINNEWLSNEQFHTLIDKEVKKTFTSQWEKAAKNIFTYELDLKKCDYMGKSSGTPIYDIKAYAHHIFIAHGKGFDDLRIDGDTRNGLRPISCEKKFDLRILNISAKIGEILLSAGRDGLFSGSLWDKDFRIIDRQLEKESLKTIWSNWDFNNYFDEITFKHFINRIKDEKERNFFYSNSDEEKSKKRVSEIGVKQIDSSELLDKTEYKYILNGNEHFYLFKKTGEIVLKSLIRNQDIRHMSGRSKEIFPKFTKKILDVKIAKDALVIETFENLYLLQNSRLVKLGEGPPLNFRTYLSSIRFRNTITATYPEYSAIYLH